MDSPSGFFGEEGPFSEELGFLSIFQNLLEGAAFHQMLYDGDGKPIDYQYLGVNRSFETMLGLSAKQVLGKRFSQLFSFFEESPIDWVEKYATVAQGEKAEFESFFSPLKKWFRIRAFSPKKGFFITLFQDITPRKKLEEKLRIREASYQSLFHHIPLGIALATPSGKFLDANTSYARILGFDSPEELISTYTDLHSQLYHDPQVRDILLQQARQNRGFIRSDVSLRRKDGQIIQVDMRLNTILDEGDHIQYVEAIIEDITHKRQLENSLEQTRNRLENILRSMQDGVWSAKLPEMELIYFNNAVEKITGVSREVFLSDSGTWKNVLLPEDTEKIVQQVNLAFQEGSLDLKHRIRTSDGQVRWIHNRVQFHHDESGKPCRADGIISDITTLMEVQHRLQESEERLRTALEGAQEALWEVDWQGRTIEVSPHFWSLLGYPKEPSQPTCMDFPQMERLVHPDDQFSGDFSGESFSAQRG
ncbi:MAG TPA: PAS domain S-box protein, partial [Thermotogota bacterium]|nr:PAS domain S-box protein [Thermotogota bacterium]